MKKTKVGIVSLGCSKNQVDAERMMYKIREAGYQLCEDPGMSDVVIVNTCGFIESAKTEAIETILELCELKKEGRIKKVIVTGCLAQRYKDEISKEIPEADAVLGIGSNDDIANVITKLLNDDLPDPILEFDYKEKLSLDGERVLSTLPFYAYLKIAEGCSNRCTYCAIPMIRGDFRSKPIEKVVAEAKSLVKYGVKELIVIAQDTTRYGEDLYGESRLPELLHELCAIEGVKWVRVLYCYPERVTDKLLDTFANEDKLCKYIDLPIQHCDDHILKRMNRESNEKSLRELIEKIRERVPSMIIRTTLITGFPGETEEQFTKLAEFVRDMRFDRLGCFTYSAEEGTPAATFPDQVEQEIKEARSNNIMELQMIIAEQKNDDMLGKVLDTVVEGYDKYAQCYFGRTYADAPDIDGKVFFTSEERKLGLGDFVKVAIDDVLDYDLIGSVVE